MNLEIDPKYGVRSSGDPGAWSDIAPRQVKSLTT